MKKLRSGMAVSVNRTLVIYDYDGKPTSTRVVKGEAGKIVNSIALGPWKKWDVSFPGYRMYMIPQRWLAPLKGR